MIMIKCAIYGRYSSANQRDKSIEDQIAICREFAASQGWVVVEDCIYCDRKISGRSTATRDGFKNMMAVAESGNAPFNYILVDSTSRVARNALDALRIFAKLQSKDINVYYVGQGIDTAQKSAQAMITVNSIVDSMFLENLAHGCHRGLKGSFERGYSTGGRRYGFTSVPVYTGTTDRYGEKEVAGYKRKILPEERDVLIDIFKMYGEQELSPKRIATILNLRLKETGAPRPLVGTAWSGITIWQFIRNETYRGVFTWNKTSVRMNLDTGGKLVKKKPESEWLVRHDPDLEIIDEVLWEKCQAQLKKASQNRNRYVC